MNFSRQKGAAVCFVFLQMLAKLTENKSGERWWKRGRTREWIKRRKRERKTVVRKLSSPITSVVKREKLSSTIMTNWIVDDSAESVGGQTSARVLSIIDYHQPSLTIMRRFTRALRETLYPHKVSVYPDVC